MQRALLALGLLVAACGGRAASDAPGAADVPDDHASSPRPAKTAAPGASDTSASAATDSSANTPPNHCAGVDRTPCPAGDVCLIPDGPNTDPPWGYCTTPGKEGETCGGFDGTPRPCAAGLTCNRSICVSYHSAAPADVSAGWAPGCGVAPGCYMGLTVDYTTPAGTVSSGSGFTVDDANHRVTITLYVSVESPPPKDAKAAKHHDELGSHDLEMSESYELTVVDGNSGAALFTTTIATFPAP